MKKTLREIDAMVAEHVMGWTPSGSVIAFLRNSWMTSTGCMVADWHPSTRIADAWQVVEKLRTAFADGEIVVNALHAKNGSPLYWCKVWKDVEHVDNDLVGDVIAMQHAATAPLAICLAALKAHGIDVGTEAE